MLSSYQVRASNHRRIPSRTLQPLPSTCTPTTPAEQQPPFPEGPSFSTRSIQRLDDIPALSRRILITLDEGFVLDNSGYASLSRLGNLVEQVTELRRTGRDVVLLVGGASLLGETAFTKHEALHCSPQERLQLAAAARKNASNSAATTAQHHLGDAYTSLGVHELSKVFNSLFQLQDTSTAQVTLPSVSDILEGMKPSPTHQQGSTPHPNLANTIDALLSHAVVPLLPSAGHSSTTPQLETALLVGAAIHADIVVALAHEANSAESSDDKRELVVAAATQSVSGAMERAAFSITSGTTEEKVSATAHRLPAVCGLTSRMVNLTTNSSVSDATINSAVLVVPNIVTVLNDETAVRHPHHPHPQHLDDCCLSTGDLCTFSVDDVGTVSGGSQPPPAACGERAAKPMTSASTTSMSLGVYFSPASHPGTPCESRSLSKCASFVGGKAQLGQHLDEMTPREDETVHQRHEDTTKPILVLRSPETEG